MVEKGPKMKVLIAPMAALAETSGPFLRAKALALGLLQKGHTPAFCAAKDINYRQVAGVQEYFAPLPSPMGLPMGIGKRAFKLAQRFGIQQRRRVRSFEEVLFIVGAIQERFFAADVSAIRKAIREFQPDVIYAEFRPAGIVAAKLENKPVAISYSYPARKAYATSSQYSQGVKSFLNHNRLPDIESVLDLFEWADLKIVPSCYDLEPIDDPRVIFTGPFTSFTPLNPFKNTGKDSIVVYMGNGSITYITQQSVLKQTFQGTQYQVYIASYQAEQTQQGNIHTADRFDFQTLLPHAVAFINHGGQNSIMAAIMMGVPQLIYPGNVFERRYNAEAAARLELGISFADAQFNASVLSQAIVGIEQEPQRYAEHILSIQSQIKKLGGIEKVIQSIATLCI